MTRPTAVPKRPQPVITQQAIVAGVTFVVGQAVAFGLVPQATSSRVLSVAPIVVGAVFAVLAVLHGSVAVYSSHQVTPSADPQAEVTQADGTKRLEPLVPLSLAVTATPNQAGIEDPVDDLSDLIDSGSEPGPVEAAAPANAAMKVNA